MVVGRLDVVEVGGRGAINIVLIVGVNEVVKRREVEVWTAEMEYFRSSLLKQTSIRSSEPFT